MPLDDSNLICAQLEYAELKVTKLPVNYLQSLFELLPVPTRTENTPNFKINYSGFENLV